MPVKFLSAATFLENAARGVVLDVRSPAEYMEAHIPAALSFPLFSDEERKVVGTLYKQLGRQVAIEKGLQYVGPKMEGFVKEARRLSGGRAVYLHCWRGGMRSSSMAWLLDSSGLEVYVLEGGYKAYRASVLQDLQKKFPLLVLGGQTGSGKTKILKILKERGEQVLDLEAMACHRGSSFGGIGQMKQPGSEHFSNLLHEALSSLDMGKPVWVEDESRMIGTVHVPVEFFTQMQQAPLIMMDMPLEWRVDNLVREYGQADINLLRSAFERIKKKLGGQHLQSALQALTEGRLDEAAVIALRYYDRAYQFDRTCKVNPQILSYVPDRHDYGQIADELLALARQNLKSLWKTSG